MKTKKLEVYFFATLDISSVVAIDDEDLKGDIIYIVGTASDKGKKMTYGSLRVQPTPAQRTNFESAWSDTFSTWWRMQPTQGPGQGRSTATCCFRDRGQENAARQAQSWQGGEISRGHIT